MSSGHDTLPTGLPSGHDRGMGEPGKRLMDHIRQNGGVVTRSTALALGMPSSTLQDWVRVGHLVRIGQGLYVVPGVLESERALLRAATGALNAVVSHESAARLHGLDRLQDRVVRVDDVGVRDRLDPHVPDAVPADRFHGSSLNRFG